MVSQTARRGVRVQPRGRFVQKQNLWSCDQRARDIRSPALPAGKLSVAPFDERFDAYGADGLINGRFKRFACQSVQRSARVEVFLDGQQVVKQPVLKDHADGLADFVVLLAQRIAVHMHVTAVWFQERADDIDRC